MPFSRNDRNINRKGRPKGKAISTILREKINEPFIAGDLRPARKQGKTKSEIIADNLIKCCLEPKQKNVFLRAFTELVDRLEGRSISRTAGLDADYKNPLAEELRKLREARTAGNPPTPIQYENSKEKETVN